jgi:hypothetical protein
MEFIDHDEPIVDWRGTPIQVGSVVVYPSRTGSSLWVNEGVVESVGWLNQPSYYHNPRPYVAGTVRRNKTSGWGTNEASRSSQPDFSRVTVVG